MIKLFFKKLNKIENYAFVMKQEVTTAFLIHKQIGC